jgi:hypothetical protein
VLPTRAACLLAAIVAGAATVAVPVPPATDVVGTGESAPGPPEVPAPDVLDTRSADFPEDEDGSRVVAALEASLQRDRGGAARLVIRASAVGPRVVPPPGVEGVRGSNRICAEEIDAILGGGRAEVRVRTGATGRAARTGVVREGRSARVLERRLSEDGEVRHVAEGGRRRAEAVFEARLEGDGAFEVDVEVDGRVRVRATGRVGVGSGRITTLAGLSGHGTAGERP